MTKDREYFAQLPKKSPAEKSRARYVRRKREGRCPRCGQPREAASIAFCGGYDPRRVCCTRCRVALDLTAWRHGGIGAGLYHALSQRGHDPRELLHWAGKGDPHAIELLCEAYPAARDWDWEWR